MENNWNLALKPEGKMALFDFATNNSHWRETNPNHKFKSKLTKKQRSEKKRQKLARRITRNNCK